MLYLHNIFSLFPFVALRVRAAAINVGERNSLEGDACAGESWKGAGWWRQQTSRRNVQWKAHRLTSLEGGNAWLSDACGGLHFPRSHCSVSCHSMWETFQATLGWMITESSRGIGKASHVEATQKNFFIIRCNMGGRQFVVSRAGMKSGNFRDYRSVCRAWRERKNLKQNKKLRRNSA